jgi:hypothetical protein
MNADTDKSLRRVFGLSGIVALCVAVWCAAPEASAAEIVAASCAAEDVQAAIELW